jgi:hypothetical protein
MSRSSLIRKCALLAILGAAALFVGSAQAETIDVNSVPTLGTGDFQFKDGTVYWSYPNSNSFEAELTGTLALNNAHGSCERMRLDYLYKGSIVNTQYGGEVCAQDGEEHEWTVDLHTVPTADVDTLKVSIQNKTASHDWSFLDEAYSSLQPPSDFVEVEADGFDFGGDDWSWVTSQTENAAKVYWNRGDDAKYTPRVMGTLWLHNVAGVCARIHLRYLTGYSTTLADKYGGPACATDNSLQSWTVDLSPYTATNITHVAIFLQTQATNGSWSDISDDHGTYEGISWIDSY